MKIEWSQALSGECETFEEVPEGAKVQAVDGVNCLGVCDVCNKPILPDQNTISCPNCHVIAHKDDFLEYLKMKGECPSCNAKLTMKGK